jgi:hypothetical protein
MFSLPSSLFFNAYCISNSSLGFSENVNNSTVDSKRLNEVDRLSPHYEITPEHETELRNSGLNIEVYHDLMWAACLESGDVLLPSSAVEVVRTFDEKIGHSGSEESDGPLQPTMYVEAEKLKGIIAALGKSSGLQEHIEAGVNIPVYRAQYRASKSLCIDQQRPRLTEPDNDRVIWVSINNFCRTSQYANTKIAAGNDDVHIVKFDAPEWTLNQIAKNAVNEKNANSALFIGANRLSADPAANQFGLTPKNIRKLLALSIPESGEILNEWPTPTEEQKNNDKVKGNIDKDRITQQGLLSRKIARKLRRESTHLDVPENKDTDLPLQRLLEAFNSPNKQNRPTGEKAVLRHIQRGAELKKPGPRPSKHMNPQTYFKNFLEVAAPRKENRSSSLMEERFRADEKENNLNTPEKERSSGAKIRHFVLQTPKGSAAKFSACELDGDSPLLLFQNMFWATSLSSASSASEAPTEGQTDNPSVSALEDAIAMMSRKLDFS